MSEQMTGTKVQESTDRSWGELIAEAKATGNWGPAGQVVYRDFQKKMAATTSLLRERVLGSKGAT